jgi:hypothetical protein
MHWHVSYTWTKFAESVSSGTSCQTFHWECWKIYWSRYFVAAAMMMLKCNLISTRLLVCYPPHYCFNRWIFLRWLCGVAGAEKHPLWWSLWKYGRLMHARCPWGWDLGPSIEAGKLHVMLAECNSKYNVMCWCCWPQVRRSTQSSPCGGGSLCFDNLWAIP